VGLQEVDAAEDADSETVRLDAMAAAAGMTAIAGLRLVRHIGHYGNALLTRLPVLSVQRHDLSYFSREPRGLLDVELQTATAPVRVMVTHLGLLPWERRHQVRRILEIVSAAPPEQTIVLLGDINEWWPWGRSLRLLHAFFGCPPHVRSFPARHPLFALDRIWVRPAGALESIQPHHSFVARIASDHLPVKAVIQVD
jgi:endonuclease/exonuclease/phosphatase family metal-dependent hydrolase